MQLIKDSIIKYNIILIIAAAILAILIMMLLGCEVNNNGDGTNADQINNNSTGNMNIPDENSCETDNDCKIAGCSGQICQIKNSPLTFTTCEMRAEYECYKLTQCGCIEGKCDWKKNKEFEKCFQEKILLNNQVQNAE